MITGVWIIFVAFFCGNTHIITHVITHGIKDNLPVLYPLVFGETTMHAIMLWGKSSVFAPHRFCTGHHRK
jgi:hypothetical protein